MPNHVVGRILLELGSLVANITITRRRREQLFDSFQSNLGSVHVQHRRANRRRNKTKQFFHYYFPIYLKRKTRPLHNLNFHSKARKIFHKIAETFPVLKERNELCRDRNRNANSRELVIGRISRGIISRSIVCSRVSRRTIIPGDYITKSISSRLILTNRKTALIR